MISPLKTPNAGYIRHHFTYYMYEGGFTRSDPYAISLQILGVGHATISHINAMDVPFHLIYGSLICA